MNIVTHHDIDDRSAHGNRLAWLTAALIVLALAAWSGCAERLDDRGLSTHPASWNDESSEDFHGLYVTDRGPTSCA